MNLLKTIKTQNLKDELNERLRVKNIDGESEIDFALASATEEELCKELARRYESCVIAYEIEDPNTEIVPNCMVRNGFVWFGALSSALGLVEYTQLRLRQQLLNSELDIE